MPTVRLDDLRLALESTSSYPEPRAAWIEVSTGRVVVDDDEHDDPAPSSDHDASGWIPMPDKQDLGLGRPLAMRFAAEHVSDRVPEVARIFERSGAWSRFGRWLEDMDRQDDWYRFSDAATDRARVDWAREHGLDVAGDVDPMASDGITPLKAVLTADDARAELRRPPRGHGGRRRPRSP